MDFKSIFTYYGILLMAFSIFNPISCNDLKDFLDALNALFNPTKKTTLIFSTTTGTTTSSATKSPLPLTNATLTPIEITDIVQNVTSRLNKLQSLIDFSRESIQIEANFSKNQIDSLLARTADLELIKILNNLRSSVIIVGGLSAFRRRKRAAVIIDCTNVLEKISQTSTLLSGYEKTQAAALEQVQKMNESILTIDKSFAGLTASEQKKMASIRESLDLIRNFNRNIVDTTSKQKQTAAKGVKNLQNFANGCGFTTTLSTISISSSTTKIIVTTPTTVLSTTSLPSTISSTTTTKPTTVLSTTNTPTTVSSTSTVLSTSTTPLLSISSTSLLITSTTQDGGLNPTTTLETTPTTTTSTSTTTTSTPTTTSSTSFTSTSTDLTTSTSLKPISTTDSSSTFTTTELTTTSQPSTLSTTSTTTEERRTTPTTEKTTPTTKTTTLRTTPKPDPVSSCPAELEMCRYDKKGNVVNIFGDCYCSCLKPKNFLVMFQIDQTQVLCCCDEE